MTDDMKGVEERLTAIKERVAKATPREWYVDGTCGNDLAIRFLRDDDEEEEGNNPGAIVAVVPPPNDGSEANEDVAALIANAPADLQFLLDQLSDCRRDAVRIDALQDWLGHGTEGTEEENVSLWRDFEVPDGSHPSYAVSGFWPGNTRGANLREAIDAAMSASLERPDHG